MTDPGLLGNLSALHGLMLQLAETTPEPQFQRQAHPELGSMAYLLGEAVYLELFWLRQVVQGEADLSARVEHLFRPGALTLAQQCAQLPPKDHLLNWATEILDQHLTALANPGLLPVHPLLEGDGILRFILQQHARAYERMLSVRWLGRLAEYDGRYQAAARLKGSRPAPELIEVSQGAYRIGSRASEPEAYDNELPTQLVELSNYRIAAQPVSNAEYLAFMEDGGYRDEGLWTEEGRGWPRAEASGCPLHWRRDERGAWYGIGLNGPFDLRPEDPVWGLTQFEALAFAAWADRLGGVTRGAVLQHEFQWEAAVRTGLSRPDGRVWEWCANRFAPYAGYQAPESRSYATAEFNGQYRSVRGGCLHTQPMLRRPGFRNRALPHWNFHFCGARLVLPPLAG